MSLPVFTHSACLEHDTGTGHFERPQRLGAVIDALRTGVDDIDWREAPRATRGQLLRVHDDSLLEAVLETRSAQPVELDPDTMLSPQSAEAALRAAGRSEEHTSELQSLMRISYAVFCLKKKKQN